MTIGNNFINTVLLKENYEVYRVLKLIVIFSNIIPKKLFN